MGKLLSYTLVGHDRLTPVVNRASGNVSRSSGQMSAAFAKTAAVMAGMAMTLGPLLAKSITAAQHSNDVMAQTAAVLKSTGNTAHTSMKQIADLTSALMNKTAVDDEAIRSGANMLLTFTNIRNEAG